MDGWPILLRRCLHALFINCEFLHCLQHIALLFTWPWTTRSLSNRHYPVCKHMWYRTSGAAPVVQNYTIFEGLNHLVKAESLRCSFHELRKVTQTCFIELTLSCLQAALVSHRFLSVEMWNAFTARSCWYRRQADCRKIASCLLSSRCFAKRWR